MQSESSATVSTSLGLAMLRFLKSSGKCIIVVDIPTSYLKEVWVSEAIIEFVVHVLDSMVRNFAVFVNPLVGNLDEIVMRSKVFKELSARGLLIVKEEVPRIEVEIQRYGRLHRCRILLLNRLGLPVFLAIPRTAEYSSLATSIPLYVQYVSESTLLHAHPREVHLNVAKIYTMTSPWISVVVFEKLVLGDGPIHGCVVRLPQNFFFVGDPLCVDEMLREFMKIPRDPYIDLIKRMGRHSCHVDAIHGAIATRKPYMHNLYHALRKLAR